MKTRKHTTPLLSALAVSMLCANLVATVSAHGIYEKYDTEGWTQPVITVLMQGISHQGIGGPGGNSSLSASSEFNTGELPDVLAAQPGPAVSGNVSGNSAGGQQGMTATGSGNHADDAEHNSGNQSSTGAGASDNGDNGQQSMEQPASGNGSGDSLDGYQTTAITGSGNSAGGQLDLGTDVSGSNSNGQPNMTTDMSDAQQTPDSVDQAAPTQYAFTEVSQDYFDDALFIGDSRVTGVELYSGWDNLTYYAEGGMTIYNMFQSKTAQVDGQTMTIEEALQKRSFGKIYLEIGINEMGTGTVDSFMKAYEDAVNHLRELQPEAILYVCGIMYVKQSKSESDPIFNNPAIQERNDRIAALADGENIFYLDINEVATDETGNLNPDYTWDEVHLLGKYDVIWLEYFSSHGIVKDT